MDVETTTRRRAGVTLVEIRVENDAEDARRVRVESELDGPVWCPLRHGSPAPGWDESGYTGTVPASGRLALGFASPADPVETPVSVTVVGSGSEGAGTASAQDVVAELGDPRPPRDAVTQDRPTTGGGPLGAVEGDTTRALRHPTDETGSSSASAGCPRVPAVPDAVTAWLDGLERSGVGPDDRAALDAVADRVAAIRP